MTNETIVAIYDTPAHAELAAADLRQAGLPDSAITVHAGSIDPAHNGTTPAPHREEGFWSSLFGGSPDHDTAVYDRSVDHGGSVLSVSTPETHVDRVLEILESHAPIDIDDRAATYAQSETSAPAAVIAPAPAPRADTSAVQLHEEKLSVGKRVVNHGGTRIRRFVVERPVEENVTLHSEKVVLDRRPVTDGRPASDSFTEKTVEMVEMVEEAVVSKSAHVYEEVGLRKEAADRVETVRDTVRREEVDVEQLPAGVAPASTPAAVTPKI